MAGLAVQAIGTDTGGSVRIPAALGGRVGFKPTQKRVPRDGAVPLSTTLDSVGPLGRSVACCALADAVLAGEPTALPPAVPLAAQRLGVPRTFVLDDLEPAVAAPFAGPRAALSRAAAPLVELPLAQLADYAALNAKGGVSPPQAYAWHAPLIGRPGPQYDPRAR